MLDQAKSTEIPFITLENVEVVYSNKTVALKPTNLEFKDSDLTVLLGPSGAGKSTLLRVLNQLVKHSAGTLTTREFGELKTRYSLRKHRKKAAMVFQQHQLIGRLTVLQNVLLSRVGQYSFWRTLFPLSSDERHWALECLERVGLLEKALERCDALSGGQQQRVGIARAIAQRPTLILADEPVASLDPTSSERVLNLLQSICKQDKIPVVVSLHQLEYAKQYADRIIGLSQGEIVFDGISQELNQESLKKIYQS